MSMEIMLFKKYDDNYYVTTDGQIYSKYSNKILKHSIDRDGYHRVDIHGRHKKVHKIVYETWRGPLKPGEQINHKDDNKEHNDLLNLYIGTQKENVQDQFRNNKRVGNKYSVTIRSKKDGSVITYPDIKTFIESTVHSCKSGSLNKILNKKWFKKTYELISRERVETIESYNQIVKRYNDMIGK